MLCFNSIMQIWHHGSFSMDFTWFKDLRRLARAGNFSQAARQGSISQPAFSRRIKAL